MTHDNPERGSARRAFLQGVSASSALALAACAHAAAGRAGSASAEVEVSPGEDLMAEHGILQRVLLLYDEFQARIGRQAELDPRWVQAAADIIKNFVEDYHERTEEQQVFPRLERAGRELSLIGVLRVQHDAGRKLTAQIASLSQASDHAELASALGAFGRMYRPHAAREDTVLFPAFRQLVGQAAYRELGEQFEEEEHRRFGEHGYEEQVRKIAAIEAALGIGDLSRYTPA